MRDKLAQISAQQFFIRVACSVILIFWIAGCAGEVDNITTEMGGTPQSSFPIPISVHPCIDRTGTEVADLGAQATTTFEKQLNATREFHVVPDGNYVLTCEVTHFMPGNAVKRWIWPGWGTTVGRVGAMVQDTHSGEILIITEGQATVGGGGLTSVGAWSYIVPTAVKDIVGKLQAWVKGGD